MAQQQFIVDINLNKNQLLNAALQTLSTPPSTSGLPKGFIYYNTTDDSVYVWDGTGLWINLSAIYTHPTFTAQNPNLSGANVLASVQTNNEGHVQSMTTRILTLADLGFTGASNANFYVHPTFTGNDLGSPLTGAVVISDANVNSEGHVTSFATRTLTPTDIGAASNSHTHTLSTGATDVTATAAELNVLDLSTLALTAGWVYRATGANTASWGKLKGSEITNDMSWVKIDDLATNSTDTWSSTKIAAEIANLNSMVSGALVNKGGYNANTNSPNLDVTPIAGIKNGWTYVVTAGGAFFTEDVQVGDMIVAKQDSPTTLAHWTIVNKNIPDIVDASLSAKGIIQLASDAEVQAGTDSNKAVTPSGLNSRTATDTRTGLIEIATQAEVTAGTDTTRAVTPATLAGVLSGAIGSYSQTFGNGTLNSFTFTHNLGTLDLSSVTVREVASGNIVVMQVSVPTINTVTVSCNSIPTSSQYRVTIKK